jgi:hypothetical protein
MDTVEAVKTLERFIAPDPQLGRTQSVDQSERFLEKVLLALAVLALDKRPEGK